MQARRPYGFLLVSCHLFRRSRGDTGCGCACVPVSPFRWQDLPGWPSFEAYLFHRESSAARAAGPFRNTVRTWAEKGHASMCNNARTIAFGEFPCLFGPGQGQRHGSRARH
jgi:hypothetical protein